MRRKAANYCFFLRGWKVQPCYNVQWIVKTCYTVHWTVEQWTMEHRSTVPAGHGPVQCIKCIEPGPTQ